MAGLIGDRTTNTLDDMMEVSKQFNEECREEERRQAEEERLKREREKITGKPAIEKPVEVRPLYPEGKYPAVNAFLGTIASELRDNKPWILNGPMFPDANYIDGAYTPAPNALMAIAYLLNGEEQKAGKIEAELNPLREIAKNGPYSYADGFRSLDARIKEVEDNAAVIAMEAWMGRKYGVKHKNQLAKIMMKRVKSEKLMERKWFGEMKGLYPTNITTAVSLDEPPEEIMHYDMRINAYMALAEAFSGNNRKAKRLIRAIEKTFPCEENSMFTRKINGVDYYNRYANENAAMAALYAIYEPNKAKKLIQSMEGCLLYSGLFMEEAGSYDKFRTADNALIAIAEAILNGAMINETENTPSRLAGTAYAIADAMVQR